MDTRKVATEYRLAQWAQIIQTRKKQEQSIKDFCVSEGISKNTYFYWQRKLREATCTELVQQESQTRADLVPGGWTKLISAETSATSNRITIEINGFNIAVTAETDPELLAKICRTLKLL